MLTDAEYASRAGWGHSTFRQAVRLAEAAGVRELRLFHHAPDRTDVELERILGCLRHSLAERGSGLVVDIAREGESITLG
jgi:ribonuclease BN (tRNA processing enzyme)